jgi:ferric-dicitrate binding protein FerR (iron transport regulator)
MGALTMTHESQQPDVREGGQIGQLLKLAGRRQMPEPADMRRAREAARAEWSSVVRRRTWRGRWRIGLGAVAATFCVLAAWVWLRPVPAPASLADIATVQHVAGTMVLSSRDLGRQTVTGGGIGITPGSRIEIPDGSGAAVLLVDGTAVRFDRTTVAVFEKASHLTLERGAVYIDAGRSPRATPPLHVDTAFGSVSHLGTRFEVRLDRASMRVRVREGLIAVERSGARWTAEAGEAFAVTDAGTTSRERIATSGPEWSWVGRLAEPFVLEGATVPAFLDWVAREEGWHWEIADADLRARSDRIVLHGSIEGLTPEEALGAVLPASRLTYHREGTRLIVAADGSRAK